MSKDDKQSNGESLSNEAQTLRDFYEIMQKENLDTLELKDENSHIRLVRATSVRHMPVVHTAPAARHAAPAAPTAAPSSATVVSDSTPSIKTPLAGVFYRASSPTIAPFVKEGDVVDAGQTLCIVEAMKVMNEIKAESRCKILKILVENSRPVKPGQPLFAIESA